MALTKRAVEVMGSFFVLCIFASTSYSADPNWESKWTSSIKKVYSSPLGLVQVQAKQRQVFIPHQTPITIGHIIEIQTNYEVEFDPKKLEDDFKKMFAVSLVRSNRYQDSLGDVVVFEARWEKMSRIVRLYARPLNKGFKLSMFFVRQSFTGSAYIEGEVLERRWLEENKSIAKTNIESRSFSAGNFLFQSGLKYVFQKSLSETAFAEGGLKEKRKKRVDVDVGDGDPVRVDCESRCLERDPNYNNCMLEKVNCSNKDLAKQLKDIAEGKNGKVNELVDSVNTGVDKFSKFVDFITDNDKLFAAGFSTAAGFALGAGVAGVALDALGAAYDHVVEEITHAKDDEQRIAAFKKAREDWEKLSTFASTLETQIDQLILLKQVGTFTSKDKESALLEINAKLLRDNADQELAKQDLVKLLSQKRMMEQQLGENPSEDEAIAVKLGLINACIDERSKESAVLDKNISGLKDSLEVVKKIDLNSGDAFCGDLRKRLRSLIQAEASLQNARGILLDQRNRTLFFDSLNKESNMAARGFESLGTDKGAKEEEKRIRDAYVSAQINYETLHSRYLKFMNACIERNSHGFQKVPILSLFAGRFHTIPSSCNVEFSSSPSGKALQSAMTNAKISHQNLQNYLKVKAEETKTLAPSANYVQSLQDEAVKGYADWFGELLVEQACFFDLSSCENENSRSVKHDGRLGERLDLCYEQSAACKKLSNFPKNLMLKTRKLIGKQTSLDKVCPK